MFRYIAAPFAEHLLTSLKRNKNERMKNKIEKEGSYNEWVLPNGLPSGRKKQVKLIRTRILQIMNKKDKKTVQPK